jgi:malonyl-CoA/methylmalonyl-CoA synthetase
MALPPAQRSAGQEDRAARGARALHRAYALPGVAESAVFGIPDPDLGEAVAAAVVPRPGAALDAAGVIAALRERIAHFKVPRRVVFLDELPRNAMGKVQKSLLG